VIAPQKGIPRNRIKEIYQDVEKRAKILERIHKSGTVDFYDLFTMITKIEKERIVL
jgi:flagellar protein FlaI